MKNKAVFVIEVHFGARKLADVLKEVEIVRRVKKERANSCQSAPFTQE